MICWNWWFPQFNILFLFGPLLLLFYEITDLGFIFSLQFLRKVSSALNSVSNNMCRGLEKLILITMKVWRIEQLGLILIKCRSLRLGTPSSLKVLDSMRLHKKLQLSVITWTMDLITSPTMLDRVLNSPLLLVQHWFSWKWSYVSLFMSFCNSAWLYYAV